MIMCKVIQQKKKKEEATKRLALCHAQGKDKRKMRKMMDGCNTLYDFEKKVNFKNRKKIEHFSISQKDN